MLFFRLAWAASWISSFFVVDKAVAYLARANSVEPPPEESALYASSQPQTSVHLQTDTNSTEARSLSSSDPDRKSLTSALVSDRGLSNSLTASGSLGRPGFWANAWMREQGYVLEIAQPLTRWLTTLNPLQFLAPSPSYLGQVGFGHVALATTKPMNFTCVAQRGSEQGLGPVAGNLATVPAADTQKTSNLAGDRPGKFGTLQAWVEQCLLSEVSDRTLRLSLTRQIIQGLGDGEWRGDQIFPTLVENQPAARIGDQVVFVVTPELAANLGKNNEVIATEWSNQLRVMLGAKPFNLVDSQVFMHGLEASGQFIEGEASWYGPYFHGRQTATGEIYDMGLFTAAHQTLPLDSYLKVTNINNGRSLIVRVNDRGPYVDDRIIDLSHGAAQYLGSEDKGVVNVKAEILRPAINEQVQIRPQPTLRLEYPGSPDAMAAEPTVPSEAATAQEPKTQEPKAQEPTRIEAGGSPSETQPDAQEVSQAL